MIQFFHLLDSLCLLINLFIFCISLQRALLRKLALKQVQRSSPLNCQESRIYNIVFTFYLYILCVFLVNLLNYMMIEFLDVLRILNCFWVQQLVLNLALDLYLHFTHLSARWWQFIIFVDIGCNLLQTLNHLYLRKTSSKIILLLTKVTHFNSSFKL